jgi:hypothetical protein
MAGWLGAEWGDVPAWVGSILTGTSLLIAAFTYRRSVRDRAHEQEYREREQASRVSVWERDHRLYIENSNDVAVTVQPFRQDRLERGQWAGHEPVPVPPRQRISAPSNLGHWEITESGEEFHPTVSLLIVDTTGTTWLRDEAGALTRLDERASMALKSDLLGPSNFVEWTYVD